MAMLMAPTATPTEDRAGAGRAAAYVLGADLAVLEYGFGPLLRARSRLAPLGRDLLLADRPLQA